MINAVHVVVVIECSPELKRKKKIDVYIYIRSYLSVHKV